MAKISARGCTAVAEARKGDTVVVLRSDRHKLVRYIGHNSPYSDRGIIKAEFDKAGWMDYYREAGWTVKDRGGTLRSHKAPRKKYDRLPRLTPWTEIVDRIHVAESNMYMLRRVRRGYVVPALARLQKKHGQAWSPGPAERDTIKAIYRAAIEKHAANRKQYIDVMGYTPFPNERMIGEMIFKGRK